MISLYAIHHDCTLLAARYICIAVNLVSGDTGVMLWSCHVNPTPLPACNHPPAVLRHDLAAQPVPRQLKGNVAIAGATRAVESLSGLACDSSSHHVCSTCFGSWAAVMPWPGAPQPQPPHGGHLLIKPSRPASPSGKNSQVSWCVAVLGEQQAPHSWTATWLESLLFLRVLQ
jgi:hypothetical protein